VVSHCASANESKKSYPTFDRRDKQRAGERTGNSRIGWCYEP
jgi:hypothetical protein